MSGAAARTWDADVLALLLPSFEGTVVPAHIERALAEGLVGVILFGTNTPDPETCRDVCTTLHDIAPHALVTIDEEGGDVSRLQAVGGSDLPSAWALGAVDDVGLTRRTGHALGDLLAACDVDLDLAPVLDVSTDPRNPVIGTRAFGADPDRVTRHGRAIATGLREAGVGSCGKHFPGHGATHLDSHRALPAVDLSAAEMRSEHLAPWTLAPWLDAVMTAHVLVPSLGKGPASISPWSRPLLDRVAGTWGYHGLVITDALDMAAVAEDPGFGEAAVRAVEAGAHLLCLGTSIRRDSEGMLAEAHDAVLAAVTSGRIPRPVLARRAAETRERASVLRVRRSSVRPLPIPDALEALAVVGREGAERAVTVRHAEIRGGTIVVADARAGHDFAAGARRSLVAGLLRERGFTAEDRRYPGDVDDAGTVVVLTRLPRSDPAEGAALAEVLARRPDAIVLHLGVPDAAPVHRRLVLALGGGQAMQSAAVDALVRTDTT